MERFQIHRNIERQAMESAATAHADAERGDLGATDVDARGALAAFAVVAVKAASEDEAATARMTKALENYVIATGGASSETQELVDDMNERIAAGLRHAGAHRGLGQLVVAVAAREQAAKGEP